MSQEDVAKAIGVSQRSYSFYESGDRIPRPKILEAIVKALDIPKENFISKIEQIDVENDKRILPPGKKQITLDDYMDEVEKRNQVLSDQNAFLQRMMESSLSVLVSGQDSILAYLKANVDAEAEKASGGDPVKKREELVKAGNKVAEKAGLIPASGNVRAGHK